MASLTLRHILTPAQPVVGTVVQEAQIIGLTVAVAVVGGVVYPVGQQVQVDLVMYTRQPLGRLQGTRQQQLTKWRIRNLLRVMPQCQTLREVI